MGTVATFAIPAASFPLGRVCSAFVDGAVDLDRVTQTSEGVVTHLWVSGTPPEDVFEAFEGHEAVQTLDTLDETGGDVLFRVTWRDQTDPVLAALVLAGASIESSTVDDGTWRIRILTDDDGVATFRAACSSADVNAVLERVERPDAATDAAVTGAQREALLLAYEREYFDEPRANDLGDIAADLDISRQALATRLRRGHKRLIERSLIDPGDET